MDRTYDTHEGIRRSLLWKINQTPLHFKYAQDHPDDEKTKALIFGAAAHKMILEPETFEDEYAVAPDVDRRTKAGREAFDLFTAECDAKDLTPISAADFEQIVAMRTALKGNKEAVELLSGETEKPFYWTDPMTGELCKCKVDCLTNWQGERWIVDYKTTESCDDGRFEQSVWKYGYKFQAGMYREGVFQATLEECRFAFVAQEKAAPYAVRVYLCDPDFVDEGYRQFKDLISLYHRCREKNYWPGYANTELMAGGF